SSLSSFPLCLSLFFFTATAPTAFSTLSLHDALPIFRERAPVVPVRERLPERCGDVGERGLVTARLEPRAGGLTPEPRVLGAKMGRLSHRPTRPDGEQRNEAREGHGERAADGHSFALHARISSPT